MSSALTRALLEHLVRTGIFDADDIHAIATSLDADGEADDARACRAALLRGSITSESHYEAERRRARFEVVTDGGNAPG
ncbi:hypothetical protein [Sphingomonas sp.]|uniref:hypothetical protein n=1 Tax=Sphingomonas sp. TaxID=28214 RepID=UPI003BADBE17